MATLLLAALAISAVASLVLCWNFSTNTSELRRMNSHIAMIQDFRNRTTALVNETGEYAKRNPKMEGVLESLGFKLNRTNSPAAKSPSK